MSLAPGLFGTHVGRRAGQPGALAVVFILEGEAEVGQERLARGIEQDVGGFDVAVDQAVGVGVMQGLGDGGDQQRRVAERGTSLSAIRAARSLPATNLETTKQSPSSVRPAS